MRAVTLKPAWKFGSGCAYGRGLNRVPGDARRHAQAEIVTIHCLKIERGALPRDHAAACSAEGMTHERATLRTPARCEKHDVRADTIGGLMHQVIVIALLMLVGGCADSLGLPSPEVSKTIGDAKSVGVISAVGHKFAVQKIGITVLGNELNEAPIDTWGIDDAVVNKVGAVLSPRYAVKKVNYPKGTFDAYEKPTPFTDSDAVLQGIVRNVAGSQKFDLYIVVTRTGAPFSTSNQILSGLGIVEAGGLINADNVHLFALTTVHVYDGRTFQRLHWRRTDFQIGAALVGKVINGPHSKLDRSWWPTNPQVAQNEKLKGATRALVEQSLATTIPEIMGAKTATR
jgi:hypothetical protein